MIPVGGRTSYLGDVLAIVVADTREIARAAAAAVRVDYTVHPPMTDPVTVMHSDEPAVWQLDGNVLSASVYTRATSMPRSKQSAHVVNETFQTQRIEHAFLEPESTLAVPTDDGRLHVYSGGQGVWDDRNQIASVLGVERDRVTVELVSNGGAFGGKEDMANQAHTALAAWLLQRPVKCTLSREESLLIHPKRHPIRMEYTAGCDADGKLTAVRARMFGDSGPYASVGMKVLERAAGHASGPYTMPAIDVEAIAVRTNNPVCGAFRGFGANQAQFAMEGVIDRLAEQVGISGWEMRSRNVVTPGAVWGPGQIMDDGCLGARALPRRHQAALRRRAWAAARPSASARAQELGSRQRVQGDRQGRRALRRRRHGSRCATAGPRWARASTPSPSRSRSRSSAIDPGRIDVIVDTTRELGAGQTTGSRGTLMGAGSVAEACRAAIADGCQVGVDYEGEYRVDWTNSLSEGLEHPIIHSTFGYAAQLVVLDPGVGRRRAGDRRPRRRPSRQPAAVRGPGRGLGPHGPRLRVDRGLPGRRRRSPAQHHPAQPRHHPAQGHAAGDGDPRRVPQPGAPYGIKGVGEIGLVPTAGAVAAAIRAHDGTWHNELPMRNDANRERASAWL